MREWSFIDLVFSNFTLNYVYVNMFIQDDYSLSVSFPICTCFVYARILIETYELSPLLKVQSIPFVSLFSKSIPSHEKLCYGRESEQSTSVGAQVMASEQEEMRSLYGYHTTFILGRASHFISVHSGLISWGTDWQILQGTSSI